MTNLQVVVTVALLALLPAGLYGHRFALYLEAKDLLYYWHKKPQSGWMSASLTPLQETLQPQIRHVVEVKDGRQIADEAGDGDEPAGPR